jgi:hypothetical protein
MAAVQSCQNDLAQFAALLGSGEANVGQRAIIQAIEVLTRAPALAPEDEGRDEGGPYAKPPSPRRRGEEAKGALGEKLGRRYLFLSLIHSLHEQNSDVPAGYKSKRYECSKYYL